MVGSRSEARLGPYRSRGRIMVRSRSNPRSGSESGRCRGLYYGQVEVGVQVGVGTRIIVGSRSGSGSGSSWHRDYGQGRGQIWVKVEVRVVWLLSVRVLKSGPGSESVSSRVVVRVSSRVVVEVQVGVGIGIEIIVGLSVGVKASSQGQSPEWESGGGRSCGRCGSRSLSMPGEDHGQVGSGPE